MKPPTVRLRLCDGRETVVFTKNMTEVHCEHNGDTFGKVLMDRGPEYHVCDHPLKDHDRYGNLPVRLTAETDAEGRAIWEERTE